MKIGLSKNNPYGKATESLLEIVNIVGIAEYFELSKKAYMNIWAVGSSFGSTKDMTSEFLRDKNWYDGHAEKGDEKYKKVLIKIEIGDILVMKSSATKGKNHSISFTKVKAIGRVITKSFYHRFDVDWFEMPELPLEFDGIWYSQTIEPIRADAVKDFVLKKINMEEKTSIITLLQYKKQIILQGPPGTGKTRLAKEIAMDLCQSQELTNDFIRASFKPAMELDSSSKSKKYIVELVDDIGVTLKLESGTSYRIPYSGILESFAKKLWEGGLKNNQDSYRAALAKYLFEMNKNSKSGEFKLIQFHPAYSYEDFVRGIVVDSSDGIVSYRSVDRVFAEMAQKAWQNYQDSKKSPEQLSKEQEAEKYLELFRDHLEDEIEAHEGKLILEGTTTYLFQVEEEAVRYTGDNWKLTTGQRLLFSDIKTLFLSEANSRKDVKSNPGVSGLAKQHSSYFVRVLNLFKEFVQGKSVSNIDKNSVAEKKFVLIIDEINRANLPSVLGELIYGLEYRGEPVESMYEIDGSRSIVIPPNFFVIGTMNTADRSVGHIDYAIRRRFAFVDVLPTIDPIKNKLAKGMFEKVSKLFVSNYAEVISSQATPKRANTLMADFRPEEVWIGHSYFLNSEGRENDNDEIKIKMKYEVLPLLKEYVKDGILRSNEDKLDDPVQMVLKELNGL